MAILSRRSLQTLLDGSARFSTPKKIGDQVGRLRKGDHSALAAEWELIVMNGLANVVAVEHEIGADSSRNLDVGFTLSPGIQIVADIVAVSDEIYEEDNPTGPLVEQLLKRLHKRGIIGTIAIVIDDAVPREPTEQLRPRQRLSLPLQHEFASRIFDASFDAFLDQVAAECSIEHSHHVINPETSIEIVYSPGRPSCLIRHRPYSIPQDPIRNPIYKALDRKRKQIKDVAGNDSPAVKGIALCDAGAESFESDIGGHGYFTVSQIVRTFFANTSSVQFVCIIRVAPVYRPFSNEAPRELSFEVEVIGTLDQETRDAIENVFSAALSSLPRPIRTGRGARRSLTVSRRTRRKFRDSYSTGFIVEHRSVAISVRALVDYAAKRINRGEFERIAGSTALDQLTRFLDVGLAIDSISIQNSGLAERSSVVRDGDFSVIAFGDPDPAVSEFRVPTDATFSTKAKSSEL